MKHACKNDHLDCLLPLIEYCLDKGRLVSGEYTAVGSALIGRSDLLIECLKIWPETADEILRELNSRTLHRSGLFLKYADSEVVKLAAAMATALVPTQSTERITSVANIHICGEPGAGKSTTFKTLQDTIDWRQRFL